MFGGWDEFSETLPRSGTMRRGHLFPLEPVALPIVENGCGFWDGGYPTPSATPYGTSQNEGEVPHDRPSRGTPSLETIARHEMWQTPAASYSKGTTCRGDGTDLLPSQATSWQTPTVNDSKNDAGPSQFERNSEALNVQAAKWPTPMAYSFADSHAPGLTALDQVAKQWPTPMMADGERGAGSKMARGNPLLGAVARDWPTPTARDGKGPFSTGHGSDLPKSAGQWPTPVAEDSESTGGRRGNLDTLTSASRAWPTPNTRDSADSARQTTTTGIMHDGFTLTDAVRSHPVQETMTDGGPGSKHRPVLNPRFVETLMAWPTGWTSTSPIDPTDFECWVTVFSRWLELLLSSNSHNVQEDDDGQQTIRGVGGAR